VTLRYKWGDSVKYVTTTKNEGQHYQAVSLKHLRWTFREAIDVTHCLEIRYLWIDALCIIQDSKGDVQREIAVMDKIYRDSTLTIFAAGGDNADSGLSVDRNPFWTKPCEIYLRTTASGHQSKGRFTVTLGSLPETFPLSERGWVLQEEILSRRGLIFGSKQLSWRCLCATASEGHPDFPLGQKKKSKPEDKSTRDQYPAGTDEFNRLRFWLLKEHAMPVRDGFPGVRTNHFDEW
jgi:hypothetical protein